MLKLEELTLEQKVGLVLTARRFDGENLDYVKQLIRNHAVACLQIPIKPGCDRLIRELQAEADYPLIFIADMESGYPLADLPQVSAMTLAACDNLEYIRAYARAIVAHAKKDGFSGTWCPVLDIYPMGTGAFPGRSWGETAEKVTKYAGEVAKIFAEGGFLAAGKHYPGGNDRSLDSHMVEAVSDVSEQELIEVHLKPYLELMEQGLLPSIMTRHCVFRQIDPDRPATLSPRVIGIIRKLGFDGVVFTDSLAMMGILQKYGEDGAMAMALEAGCDLLLPNYRRTCQETYETMLENLRTGKITENRLNEAVRRILTMQEYVGAHADQTVPFTDEDRKTLEAVATDCVTAVTMKNVSAALPDPDKRRLFVVLTGEKSQSEVSAQEIAYHSWYHPRRIADMIHKEFPHSEVLFLPEFPTAAQNEHMLNTATAFTEVVFVTFCTHAAYQGPSCLTRRMENLINCMTLSGKVSAIVHFGNPFAVEPLLQVPRMIFGYTASQSQPIAFEVLAGKRAATGRLPYQIRFRKD